MRRRGQRVKPIYHERYDIDTETGHEETMNCWCKPYILHVNRHGEPIVIHRVEGMPPLDVDMTIDMIVAQEDAVAVDDDEDADGEVVRT